MFLSNRKMDPPLMEVVQMAPVFSPASYNLPQFKFAHLPSSEIRNAWVGWIRWFENVMTASNVEDGKIRKLQMLAMGGLELQNVFYGIPGADDTDGEDSNPYEKAKEKLMEHFSPKQHESFERFQFWSMLPGDEEPIEKFLLRVQQKADKCFFGKTEHQCRQIAIMDKVIQNSSEELKRKLLEKEHLTLDDVTKIINAHQSIRQQASLMKSGSNQKVDVNRLMVNRQRMPYYKDSGIPAYKARCSRCGRLQHQGLEKCPAIDKPCHRCRNIGH